MAVIAGDDSYLTRCSDILSMEIKKPLSKRKGAVLQRSNFYLAFENKE